MAPGISWYVVQGYSLFAYSRFAYVVHTHAPYKRGYQSVRHGIIRSPGRTLVYQARPIRRVGDGLALSKHMQTR